MIFPHHYVRRIVDISPAELVDADVQGLLIDLDGTLRDYREGEFSSDTADWVRSVQAAAVKVCLFSNGKPGRIQHAANQLGVPFVARALKPLPIRCSLALGKLGVAPRHAAIVGDQIFADVMAGRLAGIRTILVEPTTHVEPWITRIKRPVEMPLRWLIRRRQGVQSLPRMAE